MSLRRLAMSTVLSLATIAAAHAETPEWMNTALSPDARAAALEREMTLDEKILLLHGHAPLLMRGTHPDDLILASGYVAGVPRLGVPALRETDAGLGVTGPFGQKSNEGATALPSGLAQASTWNPARAREGGAMIGREAHAKGFNVILAGGNDLARDPRNGRNFEYAGEDPLLAGIMVGNEVAGIQSQNVISTVKHFALNDQETGRFVVDAKVDPAAARESDELAFEIALEIGNPGSVMCAYNRVGGVYACENGDLLNTTLKTDWNYAGWVMSDWGATHSTEIAAIAGLDQEDGEEFDGHSYFAQPLADAVQAGRVSTARLDDMVHRILRSMFANGVFDHPAVPAAIDFDADANVSERAAEEAIVLLKNANGRLPLATNLVRIAVIGGHADAGVLGGGGGSSEVTPHGGVGLKIRHSEADFEVNETYIGTPPMKDIQARLPKAQVQYDDGTDLTKAAETAASADVVIVFVTQWTSESIDAPDLSLPNNQDGLIEAVAAANPHTIVVLETGGPVLMPWLDRVEGVVEAWYSGSRGSDAITRVLFGDIDPSGRLAITFPMSEAQLPRPELPGYQSMLVVRKTSGQPHAPPPPFTVDYSEGADVGYRWFESRKLVPLFPFGYGLSYASFSYSNLKIEGGKTLTASFEVTNTGTRAGSTTPQVYAAQIRGQAESVRRLIGWTKLSLEPRQTRRVSVTADPRLLARFDSAVHAWELAGGRYRAIVGRYAGDVQLSGNASLGAQRIKP